MRDQDRLCLHRKQWIRRPSTKPTTSKSLASPRRVEFACPGARPSAVRKRRRTFTSVDSRPFRVNSRCWTTCVHFARELLSLGGRRLSAGEWTALRASSRDSEGGTAHEPRGARCPASPSDSPQNWVTVQCLR